MHTTIKFAKIKSDAIIPTKRDEDAGYDIYPCFENDFILIPPHNTVMIPTGIACACDTDYCFIVKERGSTGTKGMAQRCGVIDSGYRNEIFVPITNTTAFNMYIIKKGVEKQRVGLHGTLYPYENAIAQLLLVPVPTADVRECTYNELKAIPSNRGGGNLGSSGK